MIGAGGSLGALQKSNGEITFQLANMHSDVIATADDDSEATELLDTQRFDEFGLTYGEEVYGETIVCSALCSSRACGVEGGGVRGVSVVALRMNVTAG